ncbi:hypothetical protein QN277_006181 [Acacia crassicarpa]|uniref:Uncharacterized protein n=1 Tax=Acacia crassicarpa TaxID=499986 RepID=A0AAE1IYN7_9FABA|nr:hypothetical protein QN277_006181 [Acacia crassicarpa]
MMIRKSFKIPESDDSENKNEKGEDSVSTEPSETLCGLRTEDSPGSFDNDCTFKRFDITRDPTDHYFIGANGQILNVGESPNDIKSPSFIANSHWRRPSFSTTITMLS